MQQLQKDGTFCQSLQIQDRRRVTEAVSSDSNTEPWPEIDIFNPSTVLTEWTFTKQSYWCTANQ